MFDNINGSQRINRRTSVKKKASRSRTKRSTLSPSVINHIIDKTIDAFYKFLDLFSIDNNNNNEAVFLKEQGYNTEKYFSLIDKKRKIEQDTPMLLHEVLTDINTLHESRKDFYISKTKYFVNQLVEIKRNSSSYAINEIKQNKKNIFSLNKIRYGYFKAKKYTNQHFAKIDLEQLYNELVNNNIEKSNYDILENMIEGLRKEYTMEVYFFQCCIDKLYKKFNSLYPKEFLGYDKNIISFSSNDVRGRNKKFG